MKTIYLDGKKNAAFKIAAIVMLAILLTSVGCEKDELKQSGILIKGRIPNNAQKLLQKEQINTASLNDAKNVLVFGKFNGATFYKLYPIEDGTFTVEGRKGTSVALIFLDSQNKYIGHLSPQGLNFLPLTSLANGDTTTINLSTLTLAGNRVIPTNDPLGKEIMISSEEINRLKALGHYYVSLAENIDTDGDKIPDVLSQKELVAYTWLFIQGGLRGLNNVAPMVNNEARFYTSYKLQIEGGAAHSFIGNQIALTGPTGDPYNDIQLDWYKKAPEVGGNRSFMATFTRPTHASPGGPLGTLFSPFKEGTYNLTLNGNQHYSFKYANVNMKFNLVLPIPTLMTNAEGRLTSIRFSYKLHNGTAVIPENIISNLMVQFFDSRDNQFYNQSNDMRLSAETGYSSINFSSPVDISQLDKLYVKYEDFLGNVYLITWE